MRARMNLFLTEWRKKIWLAGGIVMLEDGELIGEYKGKPFVIWYDEAGIFYRVTVDKSVKAELIAVLAGEDL